MDILTSAMVRRSPPGGTKEILWEQPELCDGREGGV
jgi:hypothetical protein